MTDYYELLGVEPDADKDAIKAAYRDESEGASPADKAKLNRAWNVLSDPVQRARYDEARSEGWLDDAEDDDEDADDVAVPARSRAARGASRQNAREPRRPAPEPTVVLPAGMVLAEKNNRGVSFGVDFLISVVILMVVQLVVFPAVLESRHPQEWKAAEAINKQSEKLVDRQEKADDRADKAESRVEDLDEKIARNRTDTLVAERDDAKRDVSVAKRESKDLEDRVDKNNDRVKKLQEEWSGTVYLLLAGTFLVLMGIFVPMTALTGQSVGKKFRKLKVVRVDGSPPGWGAAIARYLIPFAVALFLPGFGPLAALFAVLWFVWDRNRQGVHDKLAKTLVVNAD